MKKVTTSALLFMAFAFSIFGQEKLAGQGTSGAVTNSGNALSQTDTDALKETLVKLEKQSWEAWQKRDGKFFESFLADDHVELGFGGPANKAVVVRGVGSPLCVVKSYQVDTFALTVFDSNTALLTYHAAQNTTCGANPVPSPVWVSSLYLRRGGRWLNALYQQTQTSK